MADVVATRSRAPLSETTNRHNSPMSTLEQPGEKTSQSRQQVAAVPEIRIKTSGTAQARQAVQSRPSTARGTSAPVQHTGPSPSDVGLTPKPTHDDEKRHSQASQASQASQSSGRSKKGYKTHIGPWHLGKTLGKGSSARVRLCRHVHTNQLAAVKIVNRRMACLVQDSSLAALSKLDGSLPENEGERRIPMAIEREVAILKLIEHPNIMKLYDIWENRSEIYLILEYIDQGDLFSFINTRGRLSEEAALFFFRQIISAMTYCHSFNICHRDLKPENILITADLQIKIADFGMAALHQTDTHQLATACGSPHYAAPELLKNWQYRGDKADIWSMGVILYAMLSATLPFDDPDLRVMMSKTKKGHYEVPKCVSPEAEDLIKRMLQVNPDRRISLRKIWRHPLVQKYSYLDDFGNNNGELPDTRKGFQFSPVPKKDIDAQLLRQLRSMWHMFNESDLALKLTCDEPNDQKAFYWLLHNYREKQLEDFRPELAHSMSDYHHLKPCVWKKQFSTCEFTQPKLNGRGTSVSRFTVISTAADTEAETIQSYDPYRSSRVLHPSGSQAGQTKITIHRDGDHGRSTYTLHSARARSGSRQGRPASRRTSAPGRAQSSRGSLTSLRNSHQGAHRGNAPSLRHKRGTDFARSTTRSASSRQVYHASHPRGASPASQRGSIRQIQKARGRNPQVSREPAIGFLEPDNESATVLPKRVSLLFNDELRHFSSNIAKDCDEAFNSSLVVDKSIASSLVEGEKGQRESEKSGAFKEKSPKFYPEPQPATMSWETRPLPPIPHDTATMMDSAQTSQDEAQISKRNERKFSGQSGRARRLSIPDFLARQNGKRISSAPVSSHETAKMDALPAIRENRVVNAANDKSRTVSAPPHTPSKESEEQKRHSGYFGMAEKTIRVVNSPSAISPVKAPEPLNIRKKSVAEALTSTAIKRWSGHGGSSKELHDESLEDTSLVGRRKKVAEWFRRSSRTESERTDKRASTNSTELQPLFCPDVEVGGTKKKTFSFPFWKGNKVEDFTMAISDGKGDGGDRAAQKNKRTGLDKSNAFKWPEPGTSEDRNIDVKQNWLAKLFRVKPAMSYLCMVITRKRARQEIAILLREWRKYGIRDIQVDKERNIVFARVSAKNHLSIKEVEFAAEIMTVIEHGNKQALSIVRLTQERGAASSFHKVVGTMKLVFEDRNLLVADKRKQKMMIKTLNSSASDGNVRGTDSH
ncbi:hypothetical protein S7711_00564 [Stachybotrys chartarum IBT 7711]|uniref:non-specific serine/threonine protein kinase n=1 Tax=Stachybotrys chartarum (strain CBS 109288 / IBT 7711) TaxID=1280523 RepID=A0A084ATR1_STACB|nr:hypothetical protein S7711_00564 [Stachybotrys chartarum IBT 7711]